MDIKQTTKQQATKQQTSKQQTSKQQTAEQQSKVLFPWLESEFQPDVTGIIIKNYSKKAADIRLCFVKTGIIQSLIDKNGTYIIVLLSEGIRKILFTIKSCVIKAGKFKLQIGKPPSKCIPVDLNHLSREYFIVDRTMVELPYSISFSSLLQDVISYNSCLPLHKNCLYNKKELRGLHYIDYFRETVRIYKTYKNTSCINTKDKINYTGHRDLCKYCKYNFIAIDFNEIGHTNKDEKSKAKYFYDLGVAHRYDLLLNTDGEWDYDVFLYGWLHNLGNSEDEFLEIIDILGDQDIIDICAYDAFEKYINNYSFLKKLLKRKPSNIHILLLTALNQTDSKSSQTSNAADKIAKHIISAYDISFKTLCEYVVSTTIFMYTYNNLLAAPDENKISKYAAKILGSLLADPYVVTFIFEQYGMGDEIPKYILDVYNKN